MNTHFELLIVLSKPGLGGGGYEMFILLGGFVVVFYLFFIRPQSKKAKQQREYINAVQKGDRIVTNGGIHGKVVKVDEATLLVEVDTNTKLRIERSVVSMDLSNALNESKQTDSK